MASTAAPVISGDELQRLVAIMKDSNSVELKLTVPEADQRATVVALGMDPLNAQIRQVFFFDTPDLSLDRSGVVVRARRMQVKGDDAVVKLRPVVPSELSKKLRRSPNFGVEVDAMPGGFVCSGTMKQLLPPTAVNSVVIGGRPLRKLFSKEQRAFLAEHAPEGIVLDELAVLGPIFALKLKYTPKKFARKLVAEMWLYPDGRRILELSTKCLPTEAFQVAAETRAYLQERGVNLAGEQATKTRTALEFFSRRLPKAAAKKSAEKAEEPRAKTEEPKAKAEEPKAKPEPSPAEASAEASPAPDAAAEPSPAT
jgi:hypothetical protein